jgi:SWI/SNF-related matrix-associated actin-dependent regulator of chromatin subfamily A member 5
MVKEDRSGWVAVAPEFEAASEPKINPAVSAFTFFQRDASEQVKTEYMATHEKFQVGEFTKLLRQKWNELEGEKKEHYEDLGRRDRMRHASESHAADVAAIERRERLRKERETILLDDEGGTQRGTRRQYAKKERKRERKKHKKETSRPKNTADDEEFVEDDDDESNGSYEGDSSSDSEDSSRPQKKKAAPRPQSQKQIETREKKQREKLEKEAVIAERQDDAQKEKAQQAKRRLEFLLKQSNIFQHFGQVKQDQAKFGISNAAAKPPPEDGKSLSRRDTVDKTKQDDDDLEEADTNPTTFLTAQPTTIAFGKMRQYQLEGLNWMIRLQENGVNGILADEVSSSAVSGAPL